MDTWKLFKFLCNWKGVFNWSQFELSQHQIQEGGENNCPTKSMSFQASIESHVRAINKM